eukprot:tig00000711_g3395.t1
MSEFLVSFQLPSNAQAGLRQERSRQPAAGVLLQSLIMLSCAVKAAVPRKDDHGDHDMAFALPVLVPATGVAANSPVEVVVPPTAVWGRESYFGHVPVLKKSVTGRSFVFDGAVVGTKFTGPRRVFVARPAAGGIFAEVKVANADNRPRSAAQPSPSAIDFDSSIGSGIVEDVQITVGTGGGIGKGWNNDGNNNNGGFGGWSGDGSSSDDEFFDVNNRLTGDKRSMKHLAKALFGGIFGAVKARIDADPKFLFKLAVAEAVMFTSRVAAEVKKRGHAFWDEFAFVISSVGNGVISQFFLVLALAPVAAEYSKRQCAGTGMGARIRCAIDGLPSYFFQPSIEGRAPFTIAERIAGFMFKAMVFSQIGLISGAGGAAVSHAMVAAKKRANPEYQPSHKLPRIIDVGLQYGLFCAISSTPRYHTVNGMEAWLAKNVGQANQHALYWGIMCLRWVNNFYGGSQWISWAHWMTDEAHKKRDPAFVPAKTCKLYPAFPFVAHLQCTPTHV